VLGAVVSGQERTFHQDPLFAFRLLADIGLRACTSRAAIRTRHVPGSSTHRHSSRDGAPRSAGLLPGA